MRQQLKRLSQHFAVYGIGHILSRFLGFLLLPIHTNVFLPEEYRTPALLFSSLAILNILFSYGLGDAFLRFFIMADGEKEKRRIFSTTFLILSATGILFTLYMVLDPEPLSRLIFRDAEHVTLIRLAAGILLADVLSLIPFLVLRAEERSKMFITLRTLNIVINLVLNIVFVVILRKGVEFIFVANLIASAFSMISVLFVVFRWLRPVIDTATLKELFQFGLPYIPSSLALMVMDQISRFFLDRMAGEEATGLFSAGYKLGMFMALIVAAFRFAWHPFFLTTAKKQPEEAKPIFSRVLTYFLIITGFFFMAISFFIYEIVRFRIGGAGLVGPQYESGAVIVPVILLAYMVYGVYTNFMVGIHLKKKTVYLPLVTGIGAVVSVLGNYLLIPRLGIMGAAWSTLLAYLFMAGSLFVVSRRLYAVPYEWGRILKVVMVIGSLFFLGMSSWGNPLIIRILLLAALFPILWAVRVFTPGERQILKQTLRNFRRGA